jgi:hypothetical protein
MIANSAFVAAMVLLVGSFVFLEQVTFLRSYRRLILERYLWVLVGSLLVLFLNLFVLCYLAARHLFLRDTGRKLAHIEKQLQTGDTIVRDLSERLAAEE